MAHLSTEERLFGCLLGQAVGDMLGSPLEGQSPEACLAYAEDLRLTECALHLKTWPTGFGQYTDDTQLARELVISYVRCRGFDPADYGRRIAAMFVEDRIVGRGRTTEAAALRLAKGVPWDAAGTPSPSCGNGSAMRAGPVGVLYAHDPLALIRVATDQGRITHTDQRAVAGSVAVATAVSLASLPYSVDAEDFVEQLVGHTAPIDDRFTFALMCLPDWLELPPASAAAEIRVAGLNAGEREKWAGIPPYVTSSVLWSLYCFLRSPDDYWEAIVTAIGVGGDVDTVAAMTGAMAGARLGAKAVPAELARRINDRGSWRAEDLRQLACQASLIIGRDV
jgi:ADP-ribosylglycohydrolase